MKDLLSTIKKDFPDKAIDISDSLELLKEMINSTMEDINTKMNGAFTNRDFVAVEKYSDLAKQANEYENKLEELINFLDIDYNEIGTINKTSNDKAMEKEIPNYDEYRVDTTIKHSLNENFTHIRPYGFKFLTDEIIETRTWKEMLIKTSEILMDIDEEKFLGFENMPKMNGKKRKYFSRDKNDISGEPRKIGDKIYIETNLSSNGVRNLIVKILKQYGYGIKDFKVYFLADYTEINN